jgi:hypothetical protein
VRDESSPSNKIKPFYPNPGGQAYLMFDVLGFKKGQEKKIVYPRRATEDALRVIQDYEIIYPYDHVLKDEAVTYEVLPPDDFNPKARMINLHCGNGFGKTALAAATVVELTKINPKGKGLISANTFPQLEKATLVAFIEFFLRHNVPFSPWMGTQEQKEAMDPQAIAITATHIAHYKKWMVINGCKHEVLSAENFLGGSNSRRQSGRGLQVSWAVLDEYARTPDASAFQAIITRNRLKGSPPMLFITSTPNTDNPQNWVYESFDNPARSPEQREGKVSIEGSSIENRHNNEESYVANMFSNMSKNMFLAEVFGKYVEVAGNRLIEEAWIEAALTIQLHTERVPLLNEDINIYRKAGLDIANSTSPDQGDESVLTLIDNSTVVDIREFKLDTYQLAISVDEYCREERVASVCYDGDGLGVGTGNNLTHLQGRRYSVYAANGSRSASSDEVTRDFRGNPIKYKDFLFNERAELGWRLRERFKKTYAVVSGQGEYPDTELISIPNHHELLRQLRAIKFLQKNGKVILAPKDEISRQLGRSPDHYDSLTYAFAMKEEGGESDMSWLGDMYG